MIAIILCTTIITIIFQNGNRPAQHGANMQEVYTLLQLLQRTEFHTSERLTMEKIHLYPSGEIAQSSIKNIGRVYPYCKLLNYVVMPNHIHLIIFIDENLLPYKKRNLNIVNSDPTNKNKATQCNSWLSLVIGHLKSFITRQARKGGNKFGWQERYHDHIIRNMEDFRSISNYIDNNIQNWESDCFNTSIDQNM